MKRGRRFRKVGARCAVVLVAYGTACGGGGGENDSGSRGTFICQTTREDCLSIFQGTYSGTYSGSEDGTWAVYLAEDGSVEGVVQRSGGAAVPVTGSVDETGWVEFGALAPGSFQGAIDDRDLAGTWSGEAGSGTFQGSFVSRERAIEATPDTGNGGGQEEPPLEPLCDRSRAKIIECGLEPMGSCEEPEDEEERCFTECLLELTCAQLFEDEDLSPLLACSYSCSPNRNACLEYENRLLECDREETSVWFDRCRAEPNSTDACILDCLLDAPCEALADDHALWIGCNASCRE